VVGIITEINQRESINIKEDSHSRGNVAIKRQPEAPNHVANE
jgi:hypothetical protein